MCDCVCPGGYAPREAVAKQRGSSYSRTVMALLLTADPNSSNQASCNTCQPEMTDVTAFAYVRYAHVTSWDACLMSQHQSLAHECSNCVFRFHMQNFKPGLTVVLVHLWLEGCVLPHTKHLQGRVVVHQQAATEPQV